MASRMLLAVAIATGIVSLVAFTTHGPAYAQVGASASGTAGAAIGAASGAASAAVGAATASAPPAFRANAYKSRADCLTAAYTSGVPLGACNGR